MTDFTRLHCPQHTGVGRKPLLGLLFGGVQPIALIAVMIASSGMVSSSLRSHAGEPAQRFMGQLRNTGYFNTALTYLDRLGDYPGVDPDFVSAKELERANIFFDMAVAARSSAPRNEALANAETALSEFLGKGDHPRQSEARLQLGKLQMLRASQLLAGEPSAEDKVSARESYLNSAKTYDSVVASLRPKLEAMRGANINTQQEPEKARLREQYRFEYMNSQYLAADALKLAAKTFDDPAKEGKAQLDDALARFENVNKKYGMYPVGANAHVPMGEVYELMGDSGKAVDQYLKMLEEAEVDALRESKYLASAGISRMKLQEDPKKYQEAIDRVSGFIRGIRLNERGLPAVQKFRVDVAKAYIAKSKDESLKKGEISRAKSQARELLRDASSVPGPHIDDAKAMLADLGIETEAEALPSAEPPENFDDGLAKAETIFTTIDGLQDAVKLMKEQDAEGNKQQITDLEKKIADSYVVAIENLRMALSMIRTDTDVQSINKARHLLSYGLFQVKRYRDAVVVGSFLSRAAPGTDVGLKGGLMALQSIQNLLGEVPSDSNAGLLKQLETLGNYLAKTWPDDPNALRAQGLQVQLMLEKDDFPAAEALVMNMDAGNERGRFKRLLGMLYWNESIGKRRDGDAEAADKLIEKSKAMLTEGLAEYKSSLQPAQVVQAGSTLARLLVMRKDYNKALEVLDNETYGPLTLLEGMDEQDPAAAGNIYMAVFKSLVGKMLADPDPSQYLDRMESTMEKLQEVYNAPESQARLASTYRSIAQDFSEQLDAASAARKATLVTVFRTLLDRVRKATSNPATLRWAGETQLNLGVSLMGPGEMVATGEAAKLIGQASEALKGMDDQSVATRYQLGRAYRLTGKWKDALDTYDEILKEKPSTLEVQIEAARTYYGWGMDLKKNNPKFAAGAFTASLGQTTKKRESVWGWQKISQRTSQQMSQSETLEKAFYDSRYHVFACLYQMGVCRKSTKEIKQAKDLILNLASRRPELGGPQQKAKYDALLKACQKELKEQPVGLPK